MKKIAIKLFKEAKANEINHLAIQLTYRLIFALFPFLIFLISLIGFFNINAEYILEEIYLIFPDEIAGVINGVLEDVLGARNAAVLSLSLLLALYTSVVGFKAVMHGINKVYGQADTRHVLLQWTYSLISMLTLAVALISSILLTIIFNPIGILATIPILIFSIIIIYRLCIGRKKSVLSLLPGAILTLAVWVISAFGFNIYVNNFQQFSLIYGSLTSVFLAMLWLNIISFTILFGALLNAILEKNRNF